MSITFNRSSVRSLLADHVRRQERGRIDGTFHRVVNDIGDEMADLGTDIWTKLGEAQAERFKRLYAEELLAMMKDRQGNPIAFKSWLDGCEHKAETYRGNSAQTAAFQLCLPKPRKSSWLGWTILGLMALAAIVVL